MRSALLLCLLAALAACERAAWNTTLADDPDVRTAMLESVQPERTTVVEFTSRWGHPLQKIREGARERFVYRNRDGDSSAYVIVIFDYGVATGAYSNEAERCRGSFDPPVPGHGFNRLDTVVPVGGCAGIRRPLVASDTYDAVRQRDGDGPADLPK